ncbi:nuclear receptor subfamily 2 group F member 6 isoform X4 [Hemicordylus capensis]|uniref:nuclear receptor subfamily 2 group F member 6 isoform X4 n=1 Tax=Hemicordylus capensis TaxID=884348 RepID=UPI00230380ED|nr:nuclear receptor subfamily 2 group F member 6 isoform X4 [Hemicordylus capensis]
MEKGEADLVDDRFEEKISDERAILHFEEQITELLVTIAHLHGKIQHLQQQKASRDDEDFSDLGSEYTASLPRCLPHFPRLAPVLPPAVCAEEGHADLFLDVHKAVTSLENTVFSHRSRIPSAEAELEGYAQVAESLEQSLRKFPGGVKEPFPKLDLESQALRPGDLMGELWGYEKEIALYKEGNAALRDALEGRDEELQKSKAAICMYQEERNKLQKKVKELQDALSRMEAPAGEAASPVSEGEPWGLQDPIAAAQSFIRCFQSAADAHPFCCRFPQRGLLSAEVQAKEMEAQTQQLCRFIEKLKGLNQLLSAMLQECKSDTERLSMLLGRRESDTTALHLAVQYSEHCLEAYEALFSLSGVEQYPQMTAAAAGDTPRVGDLRRPCQDVKVAMLDKAFKFLQSRSMEGEKSGCTHSKQSCSEPRGLEDERKMLQEYIQLLRAEQASIKLPTHWLLPGADSAAARINTGIGAKVTEVRRALQDVLSTEAEKPTMEKGQLLQELQAIREALVSLNTTLHLVDKEKQSLELQTYTSRAQEAACLLMIRILQVERDESRGQLLDSSSSSSSSDSGDSCYGEYAPLCTSKVVMSGLSQDAGGKQPVTDPKAQMMELHDTLARNKELKDRIQALFGELEEISQDSRAQELQQMELTRDFFKAHSALVLAYRNARGKQEEQSADTREAVDALNWGLEAVLDWMGTNKLKLTPDKTEVLWVRRTDHPSKEVNLVLEGVTLSLKDKVRSLDPTLSLEAQVAVVCRSAFYQLQLVRQLRPYLEKLDLTSVTHALVTSRLDYCNVLYVGLPLKTVQKLQQVQNAAARMPVGVSCFTGITHILRQLHPCESPRALCSSSQALLMTPPLTEIRLAGTRDRAFSVVAPWFWNALPEELHHASSLRVFKKISKCTFLRRLLMLRYCFVISGRFFSFFIYFL